MIYAILSRLLPDSAVINQARRIVLLRTCCIGDVVMATAALTALREAFPAAHITWAVGPWSARAIRHHAALDGILDAGADLPWKSPGAFWRFVGKLRAGRYDLAVSLARSPLMSLAVLLSGIPGRAGIDSGGRGFGYNLRVPIDRGAREHESEIYLRVISAIARRGLHAYANLPVSAAAEATVRQRLAGSGLAPPFIVAHAGGGSNPGAQMSSKRYPARQLAQLLNRVAESLAASVIVIGGPGDVDEVKAVARGLSAPARSWAGELDFAEIGALAAGAQLFIGNDTGATHLAAASGAKTVMIMGPTDPARYAPYTPDHLALWQPAALRAGDAAWDWQRHGITVDEAVAAILAYVGAAQSRQAP